MRVEAKTHADRGKGREELMTSNTQELVGLEAYSREGEKIGKVKDVICDPESDAADCLIIKYGLFRDLVVPADVVQKQGECITVPFTHNFLDVAPRVGKKGRLSSKERDRLEHFFHPHSA
jgi:sporulation protein YlmC with PRC-barrel domain